MIVRLLYSDISEIPSEELRAKVRRTRHEDTVEIRPGAEFEVMGVIVRHDDVEYLLCPDVDGSPVVLHRAWFSIEDHSPRADWRWVFDENESVAILPEYWASIPSFRERGRRQLQAPANDNYISP
jgi:hypothetical protein